MRVMGAINENSRAARKGDRLLFEVTSDRPAAEPLARVELSLPLLDPLQRWFDPPLHRRETGPTQST